MKRIDNQVNIVVEDENDIFVELHCKCFISDSVCLYPMEVSSSIYKGYDLNQLKEEAIADYLKQGYEKVIVQDVFIEN